MRAGGDEERWISFSCKSCETCSTIEEYWVWQHGEDAWNVCDECGERCVRETPMVQLGEWPSAEQRSEEGFDLDYWMKNVSTWKGEKND